MAVTPREQQIIDLWEGGKTVQGIAELLGMADRSVKNIVMRLCVGVGHSTRERKAMTAFSSQLLSAINQQRAA